VHPGRHLYRAWMMRFESISHRLWHMKAALNYVCGKCLARLERDGTGGPWIHAGAPNCGKDPVPMFRPMHRERPSDGGNLLRAGPEGALL
jgi:hypothetical protein